MNVVLITVRRNTVSILLFVVPPRPSGKKYMGPYITLDRLPNILYKDKRTYLSLYYAKLRLTLQRLVQQIQSKNAR